MNGYLPESVYDLLDEALDGSASSAESHNPSHECFVADVSEGHAVDLGVGAPPPHALQGAPLLITNEVAGAGVARPPNAAGMTAQAQHFGDPI